MKIDEAKERKAFQAHWCPEGYDEVQDFHIHKQFALDAWLARAAQPVRGSREAFRKALSDAGIRPNATTEAEIADAFAALGIEVRDE